MLQMFDLFKLLILAKYLLIIQLFFVMVERIERTQDDLLEPLPEGLCTVYKDCDCQQRWLAELSWDLTECFSLSGSTPAFQSQEVSYNAASSAN